MMMLRNGVFTSAVISSSAPAANVTRPAMISRSLGSRSLSRPVKENRNISINPAGTMTNPAFVAVKPCTACTKTGTA